MAGEPMYAVWTRDDSEEGKPRIAAITHGVPLVRADRVLRTLRAVYGDVHAEIHLVTAKPKPDMVGDQAAEDKAYAAAADRLGMPPGELRGYTAVLNEELRKVM